MRIIVDLWVDFFQNEHGNNWWTRKRKLWLKRQASIVRMKGQGHIFQKLSYDHTTDYYYLLHLTFLIKQAGFFYEEEIVIPYRLLIENGKIIKHEEIVQKDSVKHTLSTTGSQTNHRMKRGPKERLSYDRLAAVKYAEHWWNSYNPAYKKFDVDCTNYVSQCLQAGGAPMRGSPNRSDGWWYGLNDWSFSWTVAHSLRWYLSGATDGLQGKEVQSAVDLYPGDVICYDFQGDGRWDHNTIVVSKDDNGMPLVNAHTDNSRHRYWSYEDSTAWTPQIQYKFFQIGL